MKQSFLSLPRPFVCALVTEKTPGETLVSMRNADFAGAQAIGVDIRLFSAEEKTVEALRPLMESTVRPIYGMHYRGADDHLTDEERAQYILNMARAGASVVDIMGDLFDPSDMEITHDEAAIAKQMRLIDEVHAAGAAVLMSSHLKVSRSTEEILAHLREFDRRGADVLKIVPYVNTEEEMLESIRTTMTLHRELTKPFIHVANGRYGRHQRTIAPMFGMMLSFAGFPSRSGTALAPHAPVEVLRAIETNVYEHMDTDIR